MFRSIQDFVSHWAYESERTHTMLLSIPDAELDNKINENVRSIQRLAWHIASTIPEMMERTGLHVQGLDHNAAPPTTMQEIADAYQQVSQSLIAELQQNWTDEHLEHKDNMYGEEWKRGFTLLCLSMHQAHHRGQLTVLMRLAGLKVPGVYGPAKEEWAAMGMQAME